MRIAFILPAYNVGGPQTVVKILVNNYLEGGHYVKLFYFDDKLGNSFKCDVEQITIFDWKKVQGFDIIHTHGIRPDLFIFLNKRRLSAKAVSTIHCYFKEDLKYIYGTIPSFFLSIFWNLFLIRHNKVVVLSKHMLEYYKKKLINKNLSYVYNSAIERAEINQKLSIEEENIINNLKSKYLVLGNISYLIKRKGLDQIIKLLVLDKSLCCIFIGDGPERENLENLAISNCVSDRCYFLGFRNNPQYILQYFDIYVMPSHSEGFPIAILEAAMHKKTIVCSNLPIYNELFNDYEILTFKLNQINDLYDVIQKAKTRTQFYGNNIYKKVQSSYMANSLATGYMDIYTNLLKN